MVKSQPSEVIELWLPDANKTDYCGRSLNNTLYHIPCTVYIGGELGAGKTALVQGIARGMGVEASLTSPTFALEQRYLSKKGIPFLHLDLYRLNPMEAQSLVDSTDDFEGLRCIEWAERLQEKNQPHAIHAAMQEEQNGRMLTLTFNDVELPSDAEIDQWREEVKLPSHIIDHCEAVARVGVSCAENLIERGILVRRRLMERAGKLHDLLRFIDFKDLHERPDYPTWKVIKENYKGLTHEGACTRLLEERGYPDLGRVIAVHGLRMPSPDRTTIEQKLLFYADKRVAEDRTVTLTERFDDFNRRYRDGAELDLSEVWMSEAVRIEQELFPDGAPV